MKVLYINTCYLGGGAESITRQLYSGLRDKGVDTFFLAGRYQMDRPESIDVIYNDLIGRVSTVFLGALNHNVLYSTYRAKKMIINIVKEEGIDIIHFNNIHGNYLGLKDIKEIKKYCPNIIFTLHDMWLLTGCCPHAMSCDEWKNMCQNCCGNETLKRGTKQAGKYLKWKINFLMKQNFYFVSPSIWLLECCKESWLVNEKMYLVPNGINTNKYLQHDKQRIREKYKIPNNKRILLFSANKVDIPYKGFSYLQTALEMLREKEKYCLLIIGNKGEASFPSEFQTIEMGYINDQKMMNELYSAADLFIIPSMAENFPLVVLESMSSGTPVLTFKTGGITESVTSEVGWQVEKGNSKELAEKIAYIFSHEDELKKKTNICRQYIEEKYSEEIMIERYIAIYNEMLKNKKMV